MANNSEENHLIVFVKNPVAGKVKTRLAKSIGNEKALEAYLLLLSLTRSAAEGANCIRHVFYSDEINDDDWSSSAFEKHIQTGDTLGERMQNAFETVLAIGAKKAVIIGSDCPLLSSEIIENSFKILEEKDVSVGPATDGGYYLLGMKTSLPFLFKKKNWSTNSVFRETINDLIVNKLSYGLTRELSDLDTEEDLKDSHLNFTK